MATEIWNETRSEELKKLNTITRPTAAQKARIAALKSLKANKDTAATGTNSKPTNGWNESKSNELKKLNEVQNPTAVQKAKIADLKDLKANKGVVATPVDPNTGGQGIEGPMDNSVATGVGEAINPKTGTVDPTKGTEVIEKTKKEDIDTQFKLDQPMRMTDQNGNVRIIKKDPITGEVTITDELGGTAKKFKDLAEAAAQTWQSDTTRKNAEEATYGTLTKYYDRDQSREMEAAKQELAERGIPYDPAAAQDPNSKNLYGKTIGGIGQKYQGLKDTASQQAVLSGNQAYATDVGAQQAFLNAVTSGASQFSGSWNPYQNNIDAGITDDVKDIMKLSAEQYMTKYGIDQDTYIKKKALAQQNRGSSGGGASSGGGNSGGGFEITG